MPRQEDYCFGIPGDPGYSLPNYQIVRQKGKRPLVGTLILPSITGALMHYTGSNSQPHARVNCRWCARGIDKPWKGWNFFFHQQLQVVTIVEHTPAVISKMQEAIAHFGSLSGVRVSFYRNGERENAKLHMNYDDRHLYPNEVQECPPLMECMWRMWGIEEVELTQGDNMADHEISEAMLPELNKPVNGKPSRILALKKA